MQTQIANSGLTVEVDAPKSQDLAKIMAEIRAQYDNLAQKNLEDLDKYWGQQVGRRATSWLLLNRQVHADLFNSLCAPQNVFAKRELQMVT